MQADPQGAPAPIAWGRELLAVEHLSKTFPGTRTLIDVSMNIRSGEVHALVGHNGSGKSTLIKVLAGYHHADPGGAVRLDGYDVSFGDLAHGRHGQAARLSFVHQDLGLVLELNTIDNLAMHGGFARTRYRRVKWREQARRARQLMAPFGLADLDVTAPLAKATPVERTVVAIAAALQGWSEAGGVLVLDEPTAVLPPGEVGRLFDIVRDLRSRGAGILYVSHRLDEIFELADRVTVLRNGNLVATSPVDGLTKQELVELMLGSEAKADYRADLHDADRADVVLEVEGLSGRFLRNVSFEVRRGEVLGIAGLPEDGRDELPRLLTDGAPLATAGRVRLRSNGPAWSAVPAWDDPACVLLPPDRGKLGIISAMSVGENLSLATLGRFGSPATLDKGAERRFVNDWIRRLDVKTRGSDEPITTLSGGNQQKVLFGRVLAIEPEVLVMCEPTAGVDIGARQAIYELIAAQVRQGLSVVLASSDVGDLQAVCTRVLVLREGVVAGELSGDDLTEVQLLKAMEGLSEVRA